MFLGLLILGFAVWNAGVTLSNCDSIELTPKMVRWPSHVDHYLCRRLHTGLGTRSYAVTNLSGNLCHTYCRIIDRMGGKITYTENISPNFVRCGPYQARCVDGVCVGNNFGNNVPSAMAPPPPDTEEGSVTEISETTNESAEMSHSDLQTASIPSNATNSPGEGMSIKSTNSVLASRHVTNFISHGTQTVHQTNRMK